MPGLFAKLLESWRNRHEHLEAQRSRDELAFLPAALEIQHSPPSPVGRLIIWSIVSFIVLAVGWATFGHMDIVAVAEGKIIPAGKVKHVQPFEKSVVKEILIEEHQFVEEGQALIKLDVSLTQADVDRFAQDLVSTQYALARERAFQRIIDSIAQEEPFTASDFIDPPSDYSSKEYALHVSALQQQSTAYVANRNLIFRSIDKARAEKKTNQAQIEKLSATLPLIQRRAEAFKVLSKKHLASEAQYLELEEKRIDQAQDLLAAKSHDQQLIAAINELTQQLEALESKTKYESTKAIVELEAQEKRLQEDLSKARSLNNLQTVRAPVSGVIQELAINTVGGIVTPAQVLMKIVPQGETLEVEAFLENKDIGFVAEHDIAEIKVHTFPFTEYGVIEAEVNQITHDAIEDEKKGLIYKIKLALNKNHLLVGNHEIALKPGMLVSAEIKTGKRRVIEYFLSPLMKSVNESIRER